MINYSTHQKLKIPINLFYNSILKVGNYKNFVPWCKDSWELNKNSKIVNFEFLERKYPSLLKNESALKKINELMKNQNLKINTFDGGITVGFNMVEFSYISHVVSIEPNILLSITDSSSSHIFKKLESIWVLNKEDEEISVDYNIDFEFKSPMFSHVTNLFLNFLGDNIIKAFIDNCNNELKQNTIKNSSIHTNISDVIEYRLNKIKFDSIQEEILIKNLMNKLNELKKIDLFEVEKLIEIISYNKSALKKLAFLSENAVWSNKIQIEKIKNEMCKNLH